MPRNLPDNKCKHWPPFLPLINTAVQVVLLSLLRDSNIIRDVNAWFEEVYRIPSTIKILFSGNNHLATVLANFFSRKSKICIMLEHAPINVNNGSNFRFTAHACLFLA